MASEFDLRGKVALITGGNGGIGLGMAEGLAAAGADVVIWGGNPDKNAAAEAKLRAHGQRAHAYAASKGALIAVIRALAVEFARYGITANAILPGWIETEMTAAGIADPKFSAAVLPRIPLRRWGRRDDFAGIAVYLVSDASRYHTGDSFVIDGAYTIF